MSYNFKDLQAVTFQWAADSTKYGVIAQEVNPELAVRDTAPANNIVMNSGGTEMLRVSDDGFYVRGEKVPVDDKEAATVYNAFKEFLVWSRLHRD
jgi:hypothetical protein